MRSILPPMVALALLVVAIVHVGPAQAAVATTDFERDIWGQISPPITGQNSGAQLTTGLVLVAGQAYYLYVGTNAVFGQVVLAGSSQGGSDLFSLDKNGILTPGATGPNAALVSMTNTSETYNPFYAVVRVTPTSTTNYYLATNSGGFGSPGSLSSGWTLPPGDSSGHAGVLGYAGYWGHSGAPTNEIAYAVKCCPQQLSEAGALSEISRTTAGVWDDAKATWSRINPAKYQFNTATSGGANDPSTTGAATREAYQSFLPDAALGGYLERFTLYMNTARSGGAGIMRIAIFSGGTPPTLPINLNDARASVEFTYNQQVGCGCSANARYIVNWTAGTVTTSDVAGAPAATATGISWKEFGVGTLSPKAVNVALPNPATDRIYVYIYYTLANDGTYSSSGLGQNTNNPVPTGEYCTNVASNWNCNANHDLSGMQIGLYGGASIAQYSLNANPQTHGGAVWATVRERLHDSSPQLYTMSTNFGGRAKAAGLQHANGTHVIQEWRLGYLTTPWNTTQTVTIDVNTTGSGSNVVEVATYVSQTNQAHWHKTQFTGGAFGFSTVQLLSTDDYYTSVRFTVKECADSNCATHGANVPNVAYLVQVCGGVFARTVAGTADGNASFAIEGQDIPACTTTITLTGSGWAATAWTIQIQSSGSYSYTLGIFKIDTVNVAPVLGAISITFEGNATRTIPDRVAINITRGRAADLFVGLDKVDPTSGLVQHNVIRATYWKAFEGNTFLFYYPNKAKSSSQEIGLHVLWVMNDTGSVLGYQKFFILPSGANVADYDVTITADFLRGIQEKGYISAQQTFQSQYQASILAVQKSVRDQVYEDFKKVSDYGWFVIGFLVFLATVRAFRR